MWLIFVLSSMVIFVALLVIALVANTVCNKIIRDNRKLEREEREEESNEK